MESKFFHCLTVRTPDRAGSQDTTGEGRISSRSLALCSMPEARAVLPQERAAALQALPLGIVEVLGQRTLTVAVSRGRAQEALAALRFISGCAVRVTEVPQEIVEEAIFLSYCGDEQRLAEGRKELLQLDAGSGVEPQSTPFRPETGEVGKFLASLIEYGFSREASDIHLIPKAEGTFARIRVKGELLDSPDPICAPALHQQVAARVKVLAGSDPANRHLPLDGSFSVPIPGRIARVRVSTVPTVHGENVVLRLLGSASAFDLSQLEFETAIFSVLCRAIDAPSGALVISGPTGSGKSSTLYALAARAAGNGRAVSTVEDPVERIVSGLSQSQVHEGRGLTFPVCLRSIMRQDPDVIMVGEMRDAESAAIATQAALTGHLLLTSVHAGSVPGIMRRLESLGVERTLMAETARLFLGQRLLPVLCSRCKVIQLSDSAASRHPCYRPVGCKACDYSGFSGRVPIAQAFAPTGAGRDLLASGRSFDIVRENPEHYGWIDWTLQVQALLAAGKITAETAVGILQRGDP